MEFHEPGQQIAGAQFHSAQLEMSAQGLSPIFLSTILQVIHLLL
jgi:hypothetical protein